MPESLFEPDGDRLVPTTLARGPWSPDEHGRIGRAVQSLLIERRGG